jgi:hypothetical protein
MSFNTKQDIEVEAGFHVRGYTRKDSVQSALAILISN